MTGDTVQVDRSDSIGTITLNRPDANNSLDLETAEALRAAAVDLVSDGDIRCIVATGTGATFNTGADLTILDGDGTDEGPIRTLAERLHAYVSQLVRAPKPVVCGVNGVVAGGGIGPSICGDIVLAADSARWEFAYPRVGLSADGGSSYFLPRLVGLRKAQEIAFRDHPVTASEAAEIGLATEVVPDESFDTRLSEEAHRLADGPTKAYAETRSLLRTSFDHGLDEHLAAEAECIAGLTRTDDFSKGIEGFFDGSDPDFQGQ